MDSSPFAKLSPELRNHIWFYGVAAHSKPVDSLVHPQHDIITYQRAAAPPSISQTCRKTRVESMLMFFANNTFNMCIVSGDENGAEFNNTANNEFAKSVKRALRWLDVTSERSHAVTASLQLLIRMNPEYVETDMNRHGNEWRRLVARLDVCGYKGDRLEIVVPYPSATRHTGSSRRTVEEKFAEVGLKVRFEEP